MMGYDSWKTTEPPLEWWDAPEDVLDCLTFGPATGCKVCGTRFPVMIAETTGGLCPDCEAGTRIVHEDTGPGACPF